jgi:ADP-heptose:LPS heptosyltransferase
MDELTQQRPGRVLAVRLDGDGDVLLTGPAVRLLALHAGRVDVLTSPTAAAAARLLPGVHDVLTFDAPWSGYVPPSLEPETVRRTVSDLAARRYDGAVIFTSFHQSPLPMALLARLAELPFVAATSVDYPGSLLDVRHHRPDGMHEVEAALDLVRAAGFRPPDAFDERLAVRRPLPRTTALQPTVPYVVVHPGASVPSRAPSPHHSRRIVAELVQRGHEVVVTGGPAERELGAFVRSGDERVTDLSGRTTLAELADVLAGARCLVVGNTGPAHLAAAVRTPVVSLFSPVVPARRWAPWGVPSVVLGDQEAPCAGTRARTCPIAGHPCLSSVPASEVADAVEHLLAPAVVA